MHRCEFCGEIVIDALPQRARFLHFCPVKVRWSDIQENARINRYKLARR